MAGGISFKRQGAGSISEEQTWICVKCRHTYQAEKPPRECPKCGAGENMQGPLPETLQFEMIEEWKSEEH